jgi:hypothetical protein
MHRSVEETAAQLGVDGSRYRRLFAPLVADWDKIARQFLGPLRLPRHPLAMARFGLRPACWPAASFAGSRPAPSLAAWPPTASCPWIGR